MDERAHPPLPKGAARARSRGFTVIELVIVVAIVGLLSALASTLFSRTQEQDRYFRATRHVAALVNESRARVAQLGSAVEDPSTPAWLGGTRRITDQDGDCAALGPFVVGAMPGFAISNIGVVTMIDNIRMRVPPAPVPPLPDNFAWAPAYEVDCRAEDLRDIFDVPVEIENDTLDVAGGRFVVRFNGRGLMSNANANGRFVVRQPMVNVDRRSAILVPHGGNACLEGENLGAGRPGLCAARRT
jgi:prepilin-type N-terminal cleavage/methylation domain-containing protein